MIVTRRAVSGDDPMTAAPARLAQSDDIRGVRVKTYKAMVWREGPNEPGRRVSVVADSLEEARQLLEDEYGKGSVFDLHNEADADRPR